MLILVTVSYWLIRYRVKFRIPPPCQGSTAKYQRICGYSTLTKRGGANRPLAGTSFFSCLFLGLSALPLGEVQGPTKDVSLRMRTCCLAFSFAMEKPLDFFLISMRRINAWLMRGVDEFRSFPRGLAIRLIAESGRSGVRG